MKVSDHEIQESSLNALRSRNPDALDYFTVRIFHPKVKKDKDDGDFSAGPYPYSITVDNQAKTATITIVDFGNDVLRKQIITFADDLKSYESTDESSNGQPGKAKYVYVDSAWGPK